MHLGRGTRIIIERNAKIYKRLLDDGIVFIYDILRAYPFFFCFDGNRHAVLITAANKGYIPALHSQVAGIDIGRHVNACQMSYMNGAVGVG